MKSALPGIAAVLVFAPLVPAYAAKVTSQKYDVRVVQDVSGYNSWQMIQALGSRLVCAYSRGSAHTIHEGKRDVFARYSDDGGRTWSEEITVADSPEYGEVTIGKGLDKNGAMLCWVRCWGVLAALMWLCPAAAILAAPAPSTST